MAHARVGKPGWHAEGANGIGDRSRQRPDLAISDKRHRADFTGSMAALAVLLENRLDIAIESWMCWGILSASSGLRCDDNRESKGYAQDADGCTWFFEEWSPHDAQFRHIGIVAGRTSDCNGRTAASLVRNIVEKISPQIEALNVEFRHGKRLGKQSGRKSGAGFAGQDPQQGRRQIDAVGNGHEKAAGSADAFTLTRGTGFADKPGRTVQSAPHARSRGHRSADFSARRNRRREKLASQISRGVVPTPRPR